MECFHSSSFARLTCLPTDEPVGGQYSAGPTVFLTTGEPAPEQDPLHKRYVKWCKQINTPGYDPLQAAPESASERSNTTGSRSRQKKRVSAKHQRATATRLSSLYYKPSSSGTSSGIWTKDGSRKKRPGSAPMRKRTSRATNANGHSNPLDSEADRVNPPELHQRLCGHLWGASVMRPSERRKRGGGHVTPSPLHSTNHLEYVVAFVVATGAV